MDKLNPTIQATNLTTKTAESVSDWYETQYMSGNWNASEAAWLFAQGWRPHVSSYSGSTGETTYLSLQRRALKPESVLDDLVESYTDAYNEGRALNDQRYDDLVVLYSAILDKTEDAYNTLETDDDTFEALVEAILTNVASDFSSYDTDVDGDLDDWGTDLLAEINARFDAELSKAQQSLVDRGLYTSTMWTTISAGVERERTRALNQANDTIEQRQLELKHKVYSEKVSMRERLMAARHRLRDFLRTAKDRQVAARNATAEALARLVERRTDSYPDLGEIGRLAAGLGAGSPEAFSPQ